MQKKTIDQCKKAHAASLKALSLTGAQKKRVLLDMSRILNENVSFIEKQNEKDIAYAKKAGLSSAMQDRLLVGKKRIEDMASAIKEVANLEDPIGNVLSRTKRPNGLDIEKVCVPLGVILIIYEARPNVTAECASLCLKTNNAVILRGGKEAFHTNSALVKLFQQVLKKHGLPKELISFIDTTDRKVIDILLQQKETIHLVIPRGGEGLIKRVAENSHIPVIKHYKGVCHTYIDASAKLQMALSIAENAKCQRPSVCNAMETLLVHEKIAPKFLPAFGERFEAYKGKVFAEPKAYRLLKGYPFLKKASKKTFDTEYLDYELSVKVVKDVSEAVDHINQYGSGHTEAIITQNKKNAEQFVRDCDSSSIMVNASTRFADGNQYGLGAEIGISTDKIHARGPMGMEGLTSYKYVVRGKGQIRV